MAKENLLFDKTEIMAKATIGEGNQKMVTVVNLRSDQINSISILPFEEKKLFSKKPSEKIEINASGYGEPIVYTKLKEKGHWDHYKAGLKRFAEDNRIKFVDET